MDIPRLAVIVPAYNEEVRIGPTLERLREYLSSQSYTWSVTVVSDGSTDRTCEIAESFAAGDERFRLIRSVPNRGKGYVVRKGMLECSGEFLLISDADLAAPIEEVEKLWPAVGGSTLTPQPPLPSGKGEGETVGPPASTVDPSPSIIQLYSPNAGASSHQDRRGRDEAAIAIGSRPLRESRLEKRQPLYREMLGRMANKLIQLLAVPGIKDTQCGFKLYRNDAAKDIFSRCKRDGFSFDFEALMIARDLGYKIAEIPIRWSHQEGSKVVMWRDVPRSLMDLFRLRLAGKARRLAKNPESGGAG